MSDVGIPTIRIHWSFGKSLYDMGTIGAIVQIVIFYIRSTLSFPIMKSKV